MRMRARYLYLNYVLPAGPIITSDSFTAVLFIVQTLTKKKLMAHAGDCWLVEVCVIVYIYANVYICSLTGAEGM